MAEGIAASNSHGSSSRNLKTPIFKHNEEAKRAKRKWHESSNLQAHLTDSSKLCYLPIKCHQLGTK